MPMNRAPGGLRGAVSAGRERFAAVAGQSERTILLGTIMLASAVSAVTGYILTQCFSVDVLTSFTHAPEDCFHDWGVRIGRHCFSDYAQVVDPAMRPNPWKPNGSLTADNQQMVSAYPAAGMILPLLFGLPAKWLGAPLLGLVGYLLALTIALVSPAVWAARGARGLERVVVFVALGAAAIPAWAALDRGNSVGFVVPIALVFLVALCRRRWDLVTATAVLAALVKPQFAVLAVALFAARQWRWGGVAVAGIAASNIGAYLLWPQDFPQTITESIHNVLGSGAGKGLLSFQNVSFGKALLMVPDNIKARQTGGNIPEGFLAGPRLLIGYAILVVVVAVVVALGRRISPVMVGIVLLATATLFPAQTNHYYLVFVLPIAALVVRDPDGPPGSGIFDRPATVGGRRRAVGVCVSLATAVSIAQITEGPPLPAPILGQLGASGVVGTRFIAVTTVGWAPIYWLVACAVIIVSYTRRPAPSDGSDEEPASGDSPDTAVGTSSPTSELMPGPR
jgi:hypothetical protein